MLAPEKNPSGFLLWLSLASLLACSCWPDGSPHEATRMSGSLVPECINPTVLLNQAAIHAENLVPRSLRQAKSNQHRCGPALTAASSTASRQQRLHRPPALMQQKTPVVPFFSLSICTAADKYLRGVNVSSHKPGYLAATTARTARPTLSS